uniref:Uncharacterized protein n=1 Tax=Triticum urartu TaxID=4572 RepID=A0A8R7Q582_TRIUA
MVACVGEAPDHSFVEECVLARGGAEGLQRGVQAAGGGVG